MRLAIFTSSIYPYEAHGAEIGIFYLARELALLDHDVLLYLSESPPSRAPVERVEVSRRMKVVYSEGVPVRFIYNLSFVVAALIRLSRRREKPVLVAVNIPTLLSLAVAYLCRVLLGVPYFVIIHGPPDLEPSLTLVRRLQCFLIRGAARVVCVSRHLAQFVRISCLSPSQLLDIIPNGYDESEIRRATLIPSHDTGRPELAFVGSLNENKDPLTLIKGFKIVSESMPNVLLNVVGSGPLESEVRDFVRKEDLQDRVMFHGLMPHSEVLRLLSRCYLLVLTSHQEGIPTIVVEALAMGKPIVATAVGGLPEIVVDGKNGFLVPVNGAEHLARCVLRILGDPVLGEKLAMEAKASVSGFKWSHIAGLYNDLILSIVQGQST